MIDFVLPNVTNMCESEQHDGIECQVLQTFQNGYIFEEWGADEAFCSSWLLYPSQRLWSPTVLAFTYFFSLLYCFLGVAIVADVFMGAIEVITSKTYAIGERENEHGEMEPIIAHIWNPTVANLSLMALGSSAPEILLAIIGTINTLDDTPDVLGPATIVGSAAFNLLVISGICIYSIPDGEGRRVKQVWVYGITAFCSVFAYIWLFIVLMDEVVKAWEAWCTFFMFWVLLYAAWAADNNFWRGGKDKVEADNQQLASLSSEILFLAKEMKAKASFKRSSVAEQDQIVRDTIAERLLKKVTPPPSHMKYRMNAIRGLSGRRRALPTESKNKVLAATEVETTSQTKLVTNPTAEGMTARPQAVEMHETVCTFKFRSLAYAVLENVGKMKVHVQRTGPADFEASVLYSTRDGTANETEDYVGVKDGKLTFKPNEREQIISIEIVDDTQWEPDETFFIKLHDASSAAGKEVAISERSSDCEVTILNDDAPGTLAFTFAKMTVKESDGEVDILVQRKNGSDGEVAVEYKTLDASAVHDMDYRKQSGVLKFEHGEASKTITVKIIDNNNDQEIHTSFKVLLTSPTGGAVLSALKQCTVEICHDDQFTNMIDKMSGLIKLRKSKFVIGTSSWAEQFQDAMTIQGDMDETGQELPPTTTDYAMHFLTMFWKVLFAFCPPTEYLGGWFCFGVAILMIGMLTAVIGELAALLGCIVGLKTSVTAITLVALGTSLPDTFASKQAAVQDPHADASIGNVVGSNSVNVFLGLGLPWVIGSLYKGGDYPYPKGDLEFSVIVFCACACCCFMVLCTRRAVVGVELGGPRTLKLVSALICISLWLIYVTLASMKAYGYI